MFGKPLRAQTTTWMGKLVSIGKVMTSLMVITFGIGQSAGKVSKFVMVRI